MHTSLIITSIAPPNAVMEAFAKGCRENDIEFFVIGDAKSPKQFFIEGCKFVSIEEQKRLPFKLAKLLPENHYSKKNIGYLLSKDKEVIIETDDDNIPKENFWKREDDLPLAPQLEQQGWVNIYMFFYDFTFGEKIIWPRGLPMEKIYDFIIALNESVQKGASLTKPINYESIKIIQSLADGNPDVDAVYRLTFPLPFYFDEGKKIALSKGAWCPFNSQNTTWFKEAFPLMYLPSYCSFRMTDIWRSFIAQRIAWECGWNILFESPTVIQERNEHDLLKDFADEMPGYQNNDRIKKSLEDLNLKSGEESIRENLLRCYKVMTENKWIGNKEMELVEAWCEEIGLL